MKKLISEVMLFEKSFVKCVIYFFLNDQVSNPKNWINIPFSKYQKTSLNYLKMDSFVVQFNSTLLPTPFTAFIDDILLKKIMALDEKETIAANLENKTFHTKTESIRDVLHCLWEETGLDCNTSVILYKNNSLHQDSRLCDIEWGDEDIKHVQIV